MENNLPFSDFPVIECNLYCGNCGNVTGHYATDYHDCVIYTCAICEHATPDLIGNDAE